MKKIILIFLLGLVLAPIALAQSKPKLVSKENLYNLTPMSVSSGGGGVYGISGSVNSQIGFFYFIKKGNIYEPKMISGDITLKTDTDRPYIEDYCREFNFQNECIDDFYVIHVSKDYIK